MIKCAITGYSGVLEKNFKKLPLNLFFKGNILNSRKLKIGS